MALYLLENKAELLHYNEAVFYHYSCAGLVIEAFGHFLVGGNYAVGLVVFTILVNLWSVRASATANEQR